MADAQRGVVRRWLSAARHPVRRDGVIAAALLVVPWTVALALLVRHRLDTGSVGTVATFSLGLPALWLGWVSYPGASRDSGGRAGARHRGGRGFPDRPHRRPGRAGCRQAGHRAGRAAAGVRAGRCLYPGQRGQSHRLHSIVPAAAAGLLRLLAFCAPEPVPLRLLLQAGRGLPKGLRRPVAKVLKPLADPLATSDAIAALRRYSLVTPAGDKRVSVHRLVQAVTADQIPPGLREAWRAAAAAVVEALIPADIKLPGSWTACAELLPHARAGGLSLT